MTPVIRDYNAVDLRLGEQLRAMRHLRPGTQLPDPVGTLERQLRTDLLHLPDETDPAAWLQEQRSAICAQVALRLVLSYAIHVRRSQRAVDSTRASLGASVISHEKHSLLGRLADPRVSWNLPDSWNNTLPELVSPEQLVETVIQLRRSTRLEQSNAPALSVGRPEEEYLLSDLLRLPHETEPLGWLRGQRSAESAKLAIRSIVAQCCPTVGVIMATPSSRPPIRPGARIALGRALRATVEQVTFFELGFALRLRVRIVDRKTDPLMLVQWDGFNRASDEQENSYIIQVADQGSASTLRGWRGDLTLACYPAIGEARALTWRAQPAVLTRLRMPEDEGQRLLAIPSSSLGDLNWTLHIP